MICLRKISRLMREIFSCGLTVPPFLLWSEKFLGGGSILLVWSYTNTWNINLNLQKKKKKKKFPCLFKTCLIATLKEAGPKVILFELKEKLPTTHFHTFQLIRYKSFHVSNSLLNYTQRNEIISRAWLLCCNINEEEKMIYQLRGGELR